MNGYALASSFRQLRESWRFTSLEADLYYELVGIANERGWPAEFQYSNPLICATIGISEKSLIAARNRLKQAGLLDFVSGQKRSPTAYKLLQKGLPQVSKSGGKKGSVSDSVSDSPLYKELKPKETELNKTLQLQREAADAARVEFEKKIGHLQFQFEQMQAQPQASHTRGAADAPTRKRKTAPKQPELLTGPLATLLNPGGPANDVQGLRKPLTQEEADKLVAEFGAGPVSQIMQQMANYAKLSSYTSVNLTARNWLEKRTDTTKSTSHAIRPNGAQQSAGNTRYHTTARGGFGGFAGPRGIAAQPLGSAGAGRPVGEVPGAAG